MTRGAAAAGGSPSRWGVVYASICVAVLTTLVSAALHAQPAPGGDAGARVPFDAWLDSVRDEALGRGIRPEIVEAALTDLTPAPQVLQRDRNQTEFRLTLTEYLRRRLTPATVRLARRMSARYPTWLGRVSDAYGVDRRIVVSIWGLESSFGRLRGAHPTIRALATLAWDGRRGEFFRGQLLDALTILDRGDAPLARLKGSWAGAMGQVQFLPSSYLAWAVDFDEDGRRDIWTSLPDVFGSIANYLKGHGWTPGLDWGYEITIPPAAHAAMDALPRRSEGCRAVRQLTEPRPLQAWRADGLSRRSGGRVPASDHPASLLLVDSRAFLVTGNYEALLTYNCAHTYALSVALLADRLPGD